MLEIKYEAFKTVPYDPNSCKDPTWEKAIEREMAKAEVRGAIRDLERNPLVKIASKI